MLKDVGSGKPRGIPTAMSVFERGVRRVIGGGEMRDWGHASNFVRGGGDLGDALKFFAGCKSMPQQRLLCDVYSLKIAREVLDLPTGLPVPDGPGACKIKNYNEDATAGPWLRAFGVRKKMGLKASLESVMWEFYDAVGRGELLPEDLPYLTARVGFRTKLLERDKAMEKLSKGESMGRAVVMLDALEQAASSPLYNVMSDLAAHNHEKEHGVFRNYVVRASSQWRKLWDEIKSCQVMVELDWKKFDRERPPEDLLFMIDLVCSCFEPRSPREVRLLAGYKVCMRRALVDRLFILDSGSIFSVRGMVPSGSLWTGWIDTGLNALYLTHVFQDLGIPRSLFCPKCAGDDNLTPFFRDYDDAVLLRGRELLNEYFNAGIEEEEFLIHRPPFHVITEQAVFPPGLDLSRGTSKIISQARWVEFEGTVPIDQSKGFSHRWEYRFKGRPKFLSCYWLKDGRPIRPTSDCQERLLYPEGIHKSFDEYMEAVMAMVVDNPFNSHTVNHMMHRFLIANEMKRQVAGGCSEDQVLFYSGLCSEGSEIAPFPSVGFWRRREEYVPLEEAFPEKFWLQDFLKFANGVSTLYVRDSRGALDAWMFMEILRGERTLHPDQVGSDIDEWVSFLKGNALTKYLRPIRRLRADQKSPRPGGGGEALGKGAIARLRDGVFNREWKNPLDFSCYVSNSLISALHVI